MKFCSNIMHCPKCPKGLASRRNSAQNKKNGFRRGKQSFRCKDCGCQYVQDPKPRAYSVEVKKLCLKMYLNGMGFRGIARVTDIDHTTIINWVEESGESLSDEPQDSEIPEITEVDGEGRWGFPSLSNRHVDELQTFVGNKKNKFS